MPRGRVEHFGTVHVQGGGVPGGHTVLIDQAEPHRAPFVTPMAECHSVPLQHSDVVADIGAYVGTYTLICARYPVCLVRSYEPTPRTLGVLRANACRLPNIAIIPAAVVGDAHKDPTALLHVSAGIGVTNSLVQHLRKKEHMAVPAVPYREAVRGTTVVKIDVEGAEYDFPVVEDARARPELRALIVDFHPMAGRDWCHAAQQMVRGIEDAGFRPLVAPRFGASGWQRAGSWVRAGAAPGAEGCTALLGGLQCCGCGTMFAQARGHKALCAACQSQWSARHLRAFGYKPHKTKMQVS